MVMVWGGLAVVLQRDGLFQLCESLVILPDSHRDEPGLTHTLSSLSFFFYSNLASAKLFKQSLLIGSLLLLLLLLLNFFLLKY